MKTIILILAILAVAAAAPRVSRLHYRNLFKNPVKEINVKPHPRIIGGQEAEPHSIPYQVFLEIRDDSGGWYCGGSLISENYVLTAGHCGDGGNKAKVTLGAHKIFENEDTQVVADGDEITVHPDYDSEQITDDIAVIKLSEPVTLTDAIQTVTLPSNADADNTYVGATARISGWGLTNGYNDDLSDVLNYVDVRVISNKECEETFGDRPNSNICTSGDDYTGSCNGDSGGPLVTDDRQIGIVSFGWFLCVPGFPSAFTRVTSYLDWIAANTDVQIQ